MFVACSLPAVLSLFLAVLLGFLPSEVVALNNEFYGEVSGRKERHPWQ